MEFLCPAPLEALACRCNMGWPSARFWCCSDIWRRTPYSGAAFERPPEDHRLSLGPCDVRSADSVSDTVLTGGADAGTTGGGGLVALVWVGGGGGMLDAVWVVASAFCASASCFTWALFAAGDA